MVGAVATIISREELGVRKDPAITFLAGMLFAGAAGAAQFHVDPSGNDADSGSDTTPWATLQHAADTVAAGDTVIVHAGTYNGFNLSTSGAAGNPITFSADSGVVIAQPNAATGDGINLEGASHVVIEGFTVQGASPGLIRNGLRAVLAEQVTFRDNITFDNAERGIFTGFVDDVVIERNEAAGSMDEHGIYVSNSGDRPVIRDNYVHDNNAAGIHMNGDVNAGGDGVISGAVVERNVIVNNGEGGGAGINCDGVQDSVIRNNLIIGGHASGITLFRTDGGAASKRNLVVNNTIVNDGDGRWAITVRDGSTGNTLVNNIFLSRASFPGAIDVHTDSLPGLVSDYNAVEDQFTTSSGDSGAMSLAQWRSLTGQDLHSFVATEAALFVDPVLPGGDYHLKAGSPALDAGLAPVDSQSDFEGDFRRSGPGVDIGADERDVCIGGTVLELADDTVSSDESHSACRIAAGPALQVGASAKLVLTASDRVVLRGGFGVTLGARFAVNP